LSFREQGSVCHSEKRSDEESRFGSLITKTFSPQWTQRSARRQEGQKFVRREMKRQRPVCHSEKRSDEESRFGSLITKTFSPQWTQRRAKPFFGERPSPRTFICRLHRFARMKTRALLPPRSKQYSAPSFPQIITP